VLGWTQQPSAKLAGDFGDCAGAGGACRIGAVLRSMQNASNLIPASNRRNLLHYCSIFGALRYDADHGPNSFSAT